MAQRPTRHGRVDRCWVRVSRSPMVRIVPPVTRGDNLGRWDRGDGSEARGTNSVQHLVRRPAEVALVCSENRDVEVTDAAAESLVSDGPRFKSACPDKGTFYGKVECHVPLFLSTGSGIRGIVPRRITVPRVELLQEGTWPRPRSSRLSLRARRFDCSDSPAGRCTFQPPFTRALARGGSCAL